MNSWPRKKKQDRSAVTRTMPIDEGGVHVPLFKVYGSWIEPFPWSAYGILTFDKHKANKGKASKGKVGKGKANKGKANKGKVGKGKASKCRTGEPMTCKEAWRKFNRWKRKMAKAMCRKIEYLFVYDAEHPDKPHIHVLLAGTEGMDMAYWADRWAEKVGVVKKLVPYDRKKGARFYFGKKFLREEDEVILSRGFRILADAEEAC